jgi:hypothetical protein
MKTVRIVPNGHNYAKISETPTPSAIPNFRFAMTLFVIGTALFVAGFLTQR